METISLPCDTAAGAQPCERTSFFATVNEALHAAAPIGSTIRAVGYSDTDIFLREGYRIVQKDADIAIALGGENEFAEARKYACKKLILVPTEDHAATASERYRTLNKAFAVMKTGRKPFAAVFSPIDAGDLASAFGELVSLDLCAFDLSFCAYMRGERVDGNLVKSVAALVSDTSEKLKSVAKDRPAASAILVEACKAAARITEKYPAILHASGAAQTFEALRMLYKAEKRPMPRRGEAEMLLAACITDFYIKSLSAVKPEFPPDNNKRIDSVCEYLNADLRRACIHTTPIFPPYKMRLYEYRRDEFRAELAKLLVRLKTRQNKAWQVFKRLFPDDGYCLKSMVEASDIGICLALAPDVFEADSMLAFLKQTGRLEKYIV